MIEHAVARASINKRKRTRKCEKRCLFNTSVLDWVARRMGTASKEFRAIVIL